MARTYAGILGPLALVTSLAHGMIHAQPPPTALLVAWCGLWVFAMAGCIIGWIAGRIVEESVAAIIQAELDQEQPNDSINRGTE